MLPMNVVAGPTSPEKNCAPKLASVHVVVVLAELLLRVGAVTERLDDGEPAVRLLDVGVEAAGVGPLGDEQAL